jgi:hypothetical protein
VGKQFLVVRQNGSIRYVFAASAGASGRSTPGGTFGILKQRWRHMSQTYPGRGENNMDHVSYFRPVIGFHSTVFGLYSKLGRRDSHGCVRMGRPEARATFRLIKHSAKTTVVSYQSGEPSSRDLPLIKEMLARDFNLIQAMLATGNKGDVPFTWEEYDQYVRGDLPWSQAELERRLRQKGIKEIIEIRSNQDLGPHAPSPSLRSI